MPRLDFTYDMYGFAGTSNSAVHPRQNFTDTQTRATALDWQNVASRSLGADHIRNVVGARLKDGSTVYALGPQAYVAAGQVAIAGASITVTAEVGAGIFVIGGVTAAQIAGVPFAQNLHVMVDGVSVRSVNVGEDPRAYGGARVIYAFLATAGAHTIRLDWQGGANTTLTEAMLKVLVVMR
jgi:hypothetical protein